MDRKSFMRRMRDTAHGVRWSMGRDTHCWICEAPLRVAELDAHVRDCVRIEAKSMGYTVDELKAMLREIQQQEAAEALKPPDPSGGRQGWKGRR